MGFLSSFTGSQQRKDARSTAKKSMAELASGYGLAKPAMLSGYQTASATLKPFLEGGTRANQLYYDTLGLNGLGARDTAQQIYLSDPVLAAIRTEDLKRQGRADNAAGRFNSGIGAKADAAIRLANYGGWQDRLKSESDRAGQFAGQQANLDYGYGGDLANLEYGYGQQRAGIKTNEGNAVAASRNVGINNLIGLAGTAANFFTPGKSGVSAAGNIIKGFNGMLT